MTRNGVQQLPQTGELPPDLEILDDEELAEYLGKLIDEDGRIDPHELQVSTRKGVVYLEGALSSEPQHRILLNLLTDVAGVQEIVDHLEIERLASERGDRSKPEEHAPEIPAGNLHRHEPYGGTPPPHRKD